MKSCLHPLRAANSKNSSSSPAWMLAWLLHHFLNGVIAWNKVLAYSLSFARLSSQKMITFP